MQKIKWATVFVLLAAAVLFVACGNENAPEAAADETNGWGVDVLRIAMLIEDGSPESLRVHQEFRDGLEEYIGIPVEIIEGATHIVGIEAMRAGDIDVMWGSPFVYLLAQQTMDVQRLAVTSSETAINKAIFVTAHPEIQTMDDMAGRSFAFVTAGSASGFLYPMYHLINMYGLSRDEILTPGVLFGDVTFSGANNTSIMGAAMGDFDAAAVSNLHKRALIMSGVLEPDALRVLGHSEIIPFPGYIAAARVPQELRDAVSRFLLAYDNEDYFEERVQDPAVRYALPDPAQMEYLRSMVAVLEIDLEEQN